MSYIADAVYQCLKEVFPNNVIIREHYLYYKGTRLFFDFFIKDLGILIEVQGEQHFKYIKHFHGSIEAFRAQKYRDNLKKEYVDVSPYTLVYFYDKKDIITSELVLARIKEAMDE